MNYLFTLDQQQQSRLLNPFWIIVFLLLISISIKAQVVGVEPILIEKSWTDNNSLNKLYIKVYGACNPKEPPFGGYPSEIKVQLKNKNYKLKIKYKEKDYQMCMILFDKEDVVLVNKNESQIVFIPFFYCGNSDSQVRVSYFILHNKQKYLKHINFYCDEYGNCKFDDNLERELKGMSNYLKEEFLKQLYKYQKLSNFHQELE